MSRKIELLTIRRGRSGKLQVRFHDRELQWTLELPAAALRSFGAFRVTVAEQICRWVDLRNRRRPWAAQVLEAMEHGHLCREAAK